MIDRFCFLHLKTMAGIRQGRNALTQIIKQAGVKTHDGSLYPHPLLYSCQGVRFRKLEVILTSKIEKLGRTGQTVKVAPGYFRNHLMPKLLAVQNIEKFAHLARDQQKLYRREEEEEVKVVKETVVKDHSKEYEMAAKRLENGRVTFRVGVNAKQFRARATKDDPIEVHSPITKEDIIREVARQLNVEITPENLHFLSPLMTFGEFEVPLLLPMSIPLPEGKVQWMLKVKIRGK